MSRRYPQWKIDLFATRTRNAGPSSPKGYSTDADADSERAFQYEKAEGLLPDREYPTGALEALDPRVPSAAEALDALAAMSPEDRAELARWVWPEIEGAAAILERDELRRANVTPADADRPLGQSVEYWQDRCLDHATALDRCRSELRIARFDASTAIGERDMAVAAAVHNAEAATVKRIVEWLREVPVSGMKNQMCRQFADVIDAKFGGPDAVK